jgi:hypothetical protein
MVVFSARGINSRWRLPPFAFFVMECALQGHIFHCSFILCFADPLFAQSELSRRFLALGPNDSPFSQRTDPGDLRVLAKTSQKFPDTH